MPPPSSSKDWETSQGSSTWPSLSMRCKQEEVPLASSGPTNTGTFPTPLILSPSQRKCKQPVRYFFSILLFSSFYLCFINWQNGPGFYHNIQFRPTESYRNFNTWMGDPIRALELETVVNQIKKDNLVENVRITGEYLMKSLHSLATKHNGKISVCSFMKDEV